jgi:hypothetical protein
VTRHLEMAVTGALCLVTTQAVLIPLMQVLLLQRSWVSGYAWKQQETGLIISLMVWAYLHLIISIPGLTRRR